MHTVYLIIKEYPYIFTEIERAFFSWENAHEYIVDTYPYYVYYKDKDIYAMPDLKDDIDFENEERYYILEKVVVDDLPEEKKI